MTSLYFLGRKTTAAANGTERIPLILAPKSDHKTTK
jgi:hypothetical protein